MSLSYCNAEATSGHETFGCLNPDGHTGLHRASVYHGRCPSCGGLEDHADTCPTPDHRRTIAMALANGGGLYPCCSCGWTGARTFDAVLAAGEWDQHYDKAKATPFTTDHLIDHLRAEAQLVLDRGVVTRGQRLVIRDLLLRAAEEIESHDPR